MSANPTAPESVAYIAALPAELEAELAPFSALPRIKGRDKALEFVKGQGIDIRKYSITAAVERREIEFFKYGHALHFSERGLMRWALSQFQPPSA